MTWFVKHQYIRLYMNICFMIDCSILTIYAVKKDK